MPRLCGTRDGLDAHAAGTGAKYTRGRRPVELVYYEVHGTKEAAMRREWAIKQLTRAEKLALIAQGPEQEESR